MNIKYFFCAVIVNMLIGCSSASKNISKGSEQFATMNNVQLSNNFKSFWNQLTKENSGKSLDQFIPSDILIERYSLREQNCQFYLSGYIHSDSTFNEADIKNLGGNVVTYTDKVRTYSVPIKKIPLFIKIKGIKYIEIGKKVKIK